MSNAAQFRNELLAHVGKTPDELNAFIKEMRTQRDKFIAHLDDLPDMQIPVFDIAKSSTAFLCQRLMDEAVGTDTFHDAPLSAPAFYDLWFAVARVEYAA